MGVGVTVKWCSCDETVTQVCIHRIANVWSD